jgi:hypothetical protein
MRERCETWLVRLADVRWLPVRILARRPMEVPVYLSDGYEKLYLRGASASAGCMNVNVYVCTGISERKKRDIK